MMATYDYWLFHTMVAPAHPFLYTLTRCLSHAPPTPLHK